MKAMLLEKVTNMDENHSRWSYLKYLNLNPE
jgi:hypothetical protein